MEEFWNVQERVCENPGGGGHGPLADAYDYPCTVFYVCVLKMFRHSHTGNMQLQPYYSLGGYLAHVLFF